MSNSDLLDNIKKLREMTGVGFKDCKSALDETNGDLEKSILEGDIDEQIEVVRLSYDEIISKIKNAEIIDLKTISAFISFGFSERIALNSSSIGKLVANLQ